LALLRREYGQSFAEQAAAFGLEAAGMGGNGNGNGPRTTAASSTVISREWAQDHGCAGFLRKPIDPEELLREIRRCLPPTENPPPADAGNPP
jgi:hypothetical protein